MPILVVGTVAFDTVTTPHGTRHEILGGSASHFSAAASFFAPVRLVAVVGDDFAEERAAPLRARGVDLEGLARVPGRTFRWKGEYDRSFGDARTLDTQLNVLEQFDPRLPSGWERSPCVFLGNIDPRHQARVLDRMSAPDLVAADTMNYWIASEPAELRNLLGRVAIAFLNEAEIRQLTGRRGVLDAADAVHEMGPRVVVVKRGEYGVVLSMPEGPFAIPAFPVRRVVDPTGAGDSFAGGFMGWLASRSTVTADEYRRAAALGTVMASFQVEDFSLDGVCRLDRERIAERYDLLRRLTGFEPLPA